MKNKTPKNWSLRICCGLRRLLLLTIPLIFTVGSSSTFAIPLLISISNPPPQVNLNAVGQSQFYPQAGTLGPGGTPISLRATVTAITPGDAIRIFTSGDDPVVRTNSGSIRATVLWEVFDRNTGLPIVGDPNFLITDIDGNRGTPIESVSAACAGLTSYTVNGTYLPGCNANSNGACQSNIRITESGGAILGEGTQNQNAGQQEAFLQYSWTGVSSWSVEYISTNSGRWFVHDADSDIPFDGTQVTINLVDLATIKRFQPGTNTAPAPGETVTYEVELSNAGPSAASNANLVDTLPSGMSFVNATATNGMVVPAGNTVSWSGVNIPVNGSEVLTIIAMVNSGVTPGTVLTNSTTTALAAENKCSARDVLTVDLTVSDPPAPELTVVKTVDPVTSLSAAGDVITYRYEISNTGNVEITGVSPVDTGPTFNGSTGTNSLSAFSPTSVTLAAGASQVFTATYMLSQIDVDNMAAAADPLSAIENSATAQGTPADGMLPAITPSTAETGFQPEPTLSIAKSVSSATSFSEEGDTITYEYVVTNTGDITIDDVVPTDIGPTFNGAPGTNSLSAFTPTSVSLAPNQNQTFTATYVLSQPDVDNMASAADPLTAIDNSASAMGDPIGNTPLPVVPTSMVETGFAPTPQLSVAKTVSAATSFSAAGDTITYQYVINNEGNVTINNVVPIDTGPTFNNVAATNALSAFSPSSASIAPNSSVTFTATYLLDQADVDNMAAAADPTTAIDNSAQATGVPTGGTLAPVTPSLAETGFAINAEMNVVKTAGTPTTNLGVNPAATDAGDTISYSYAVTNDGDLTLSAIVINDAGPTFNGAVGTGSLSAIACALTTLAPGQSTSCNAIYTLSQDDVDNAIVGGANAVENTATVSGEDPTGTGVTSPPSTAMQTIAVDSSIEINKTAAQPTVSAGADNSIVDPGDSIAYQFEITNTGNTTLSSVLLSDDIVTPSCPAITDLGNPFVNDGSATLVVGDSITCTASYTLMQSDLDNGGVLNTAQVSAQDPTGAAINDTDSVNSAFTQKASLSLVKSATALPDPAVLDALITYTFEVTNTGNVSLSDTEVADPICQTPASPLTFASGYQSGDAMTTGVLDAGETWIFSCDYAIDQDDINLGEVANTATASGTPPASSGLSDPSSTASNLVDAEQNAAIALDKTASLPTTAAGASATVTDEGDTVSYTFLVENTGNVTLTNVVVSDPLITGAPNNGTINCPPAIASMAPGVQVSCTASYTLTLDDVNNGLVENTGSVIGDPPVSVPPAGQPMAESSAASTIPPVPMLTVQKTVAPLPSPFMAGSLISYSYAITNTGNVTVTGVMPVDLGPTFSGVAAANSLTAFSPLSADLAPGDSQTFTATYAVDQVDIDNIGAAADQLTAIDNTASATGTPVNGVLADVEPSTVETGVVTNPEITLTKSSTAPAVAAAAEVITYSFILSNTGDVSLDNPVITDPQCTAPASPLTFASGYVSGDAGVAGVLDVGENWTFSCDYTLQQNDIDAGNVQNTALGSATDPSGNLVEDVSDSTNPGDTGAGNEDPTNTPLTRVSSWGVTKSTASTPTNEGDTLIYEFVLTNTGNVSISNPTLNDVKCASAATLTGGDLDNNNILAPNEVFTYQCISIAVTQNEVDAGMVDNNVSVTGSPPSGAPTLPPATAMESTLIPPTPALTIDKQSSAPTIGLGSLAAATDEGDTIAYTFVVSNSGNVTISSLTVADVGPTFGGNAGAGTWSGVSCPLTTLAPNQSTTCSATYTLDQADVDAAIAGGAASVANSAVAQGSDPDAGAVASPPDSATESIVAVSDVDIVKTAGTPSENLGADLNLTDAGDTIDYQISIENAGNNQLNNVVIADSIAIVSCPALTAQNNPFANDGSGVLAVGDSIVCDANYTLQQPDIDSGVITNTASVAAVDQAGNPVGDVTEIDVGLTQKTSLSLAKTISVLPNNPAQVNDVIEYQFALDNTGNVSLSAAEIADDKCDAPAAPLTRASGYVSGDLNNDQLLNANEIWIFACDHNVTQAEVNLGGVENSASGSGVPPADSGLPNPSSTAGALAELGQETGIALDKVGAMPTVVDGNLNAVTDVGDTITYTFAIQNTGNVTLTGISPTDPVITDPPNNGTFNCTFPATDGQLDSGQTATCTAVYTLTQPDVDSGTVMNEAQVSGVPPVTVPPTTPPSASSSAMVPIPGEPSLSVQKSASLPPNVVAGTVITYSYDVENTGNVTIANVSPVDAGPTFNGVAGTNALSAFSPGPLSLAPQAIQTFTATYVISQVDLDNMGAANDPTTAIDNEAIADGEPANGLIAPVTPSMVETGEAPDPLITLVKGSTPPAIVAAGAFITYNFSLSNDGNVTISNPVVTDAMCQLPSGPLTFSNGYLSGDVGAQPQALDVGETWIFSCQYALTQDDINAGTVQNTAVASGQDPAGMTQMDTSDSSNPGDDTGGASDPTNTALTRNPLFSVVKSTNSVPDDLNDVLLYEFRVRNDGNVAISNVVVTDLKCDASGTTLVTSSDLGGDGVLSPAGFNASPPAEEWLFTCMSLPIQQSDIDLGRVDNEVMVSGEAPGGNPPIAEDNISTPIVTNPELSLVKAAGAATLNDNGTFDQSFDFALKNTGDITLNNITIRDDISAQFGACFDSIIAPGTASLIDVAPANDSADPSLGTAPILAMTANLSVGDTIQLSNYIIRFNPNAAGCSFPTPALNTATAGGEPANGGTPIIDVSDSGTDPDAGTPNNGGTPTMFVPPTYLPELGLAKSAGDLNLNADGSFDVVYTFLLENTGNVDITELALVDDLATQMGAAFVASPASDPSGGVISPPLVSVVNDAGTANAVPPNANNAYDGTAASGMFDGSSGYLGVGDRIQVLVTVRLNPYVPGAPASLQNLATASGSDPSGAVTTDDSDSGTSPDINAGGPGTPTTVTPPPFTSSMEVVKTGTLNSDGSIDYEFSITNTGDVNLVDVALSDAIISGFDYGAADGDNDQDIDLLAPNETVIISANYVLTAANITAGEVENTATASGTDPAGNLVEDTSDSGNPADDTGADDDPTVTPLGQASIGTAKDVQAGSPVDLGNGSYQMTYQFVVSNTGAFDLQNVQLTDDLQAMINNPNVNNATVSNAVVSSPNSTLTPNPAFNGISNTELLTGSDTLLVGASGLVQLSFTFTPDVYFGPFLNQAEATASGPGNADVSDLSEDGATVNPDTNSETPFTIATPSTPINLGWFRSSGERSEVLFEWSTEVEVSNVGFYLSVQDDKGFWHRINPTMIPAQGDSTDAQYYSFTAYDLLGDSFMLTDVSVMGTQVDHGPFKLGEEFGLRTERQETDWQQIQEESERKRQLREEQHQRQLQQRLKDLKLKSNKPVLQDIFGRLAGLVLGALIAPAHAAELASFSVEEPGLYRVTHSQLMAKGVDLRGLAIERIALEESNESWPLKIHNPSNGDFSANSWIMFPARGLDTLYSGTNKYTLVIDEEPPLSIVDDNSAMPSGTAIAYSYLAAKSYAPQNVYTHLSPSNRDAWYADSLRAITAPASKTVTINIDDFAPALNSSFNIGGLARMPAPRPRLEVNLWGASNLPGNGLLQPDHHVLIDLNGERVADTRFDGLPEYLVEKVITNLNYGNNAVHISLPKDHGYQFDLVNLDRVTLRYPRLFKALNNGTELIFESPWNFFKVSGLASNDATVVRVDQNRQAFLMTERGVGQCSNGCVYFTGSSTGEMSSYFVAANNGLRSPTIDVLPAANEILSGVANYLIIAHPDFIQTPNQQLEAYANELAVKYGTVDIVNVEDIYAQYSGHVMDAEAIREYIRDAYELRNTRHVALVGGDMYDYRDNLNSGAQSFVPSLYVQIASNVNAVPSDASYADVDDDFIPDLSITRWPVRSTAELAAMLNKRQQYLNRDYLNTAIMAADKDDASGYSFDDDAESVISTFLSGWATERIYLQNLTVGQAKQDLVTSLNNGASMTAYFGHSSTDRWSIAGLFTSQDVTSLQLATPTVMTQWGCWNTFYVSPTQDSLAQRLLTDGERGAVTLMGATSFTKADAEQRMALLLFERLSQGQSVAEAVLAAKQAIAVENPYQLDILLGWAVLGPDDISVTNN